MNPDRARYLREIGNLRELGTVDAASTTVAGQAAQPSQLLNHVPGELLVQFGPNVGEAAREAALASVGGHAAEVIGSHLGGDLLKVTFGAGVDIQQAIDILSHRPGVTFAEPNYIQTIDLASNDPGYTGGQMWGMYGDQTSPANQYGSQAGEAWAAGNVGSTKVVVGDIDTGIDYTHPDLYLNVWLNQGEIPTAFKTSLVDTDRDGLITFRDLNNSANSAWVTDVNGNGRIDAGDLLHDARWANGDDQDGNSYVDDLIGWDFVNNDNDPYDDNNHGTHTAGTIAAVGGNGVGVAGVSWNTQVIALKFLDASGSGSTDNAVKALDYFTWASQHSPGEDFAATNNSWGGGGFSQALLDGIVRSAQHDILFVAAAGNGGADQRSDNNDSVANYPSNYSTVAGAGYEAVIAVASITSAGALSSFSNYGASTVDLGAPGSGIYSTVPGGYSTFSGTSMATPHVTGAIALYSSLSSQSAADIRASLLSSAAPTSSLAGITVTGGRLDVSSFLALAGGTPTPTPTPTPTGGTYFGTTGSDTITGSTGNDTISGVPATGTNLGRGTIDTLIGNGGSDLFILGDSRGIFYEDNKPKVAGTSDYALIKDFASDDHIQLYGSAGMYVQHATSVNGVSGMGIYHDTNGNGLFDSKDELIGLVQGLSTPVDSAHLIFA